MDLSPNCHTTFRTYDIMFSISMYIHTCTLDIEIIKPTCPSRAEHETWSSTNMPYDSKVAMYRYLGTLGTGPTNYVIRYCGCYVGHQRLNPSVKINDRYGTIEGGRSLVG